MPDQRELARAIVDDLLKDLRDRRGFRQEWDQIDEDIQQEIVSEWQGMVLGHLDPAWK